MFKIEAREQEQFQHYESANKLKREPARQTSAVMVMKGQS
jgi:hypothetical protein